MHCAARRRRRRSIARPADHAACQSWCRVAHLRVHLWPLTGIEIAVDRFVTRLGTEIDPFPGAICDEPVAREIGGCLDGFFIVAGGVLFENCVRIGSVEAPHRLLVVLAIRLFVAEYPERVRLL